MQGFVHQHVFPIYNNFILIHIVLTVDCLFRYFSYSVLTYRTCYLMSAPKLPCLWNQHVLPITCRSTEMKTFHKS